MTSTKNPEEISKELYRYDQIAVKLRNLSDIGQEQLQQYHKEGYLAVEHVLTLMRLTPPSMRYMTSYLSMIKALRFNTRSLPMN